MTTEKQLLTTVTTNDTTSQLTPQNRMATEMGNSTGRHANDLDHLSNLALLQGAWFTTMTNQIDTIASRQNKLEQQTSSQITTIMTQLETICTLMEEQQQWQEQYNEYDRYDQGQSFSPVPSHMDGETEEQQNEMHANPWAAGNSTMEDASTIK